jgi:hypothetical protein
VTQATVEFQLGTESVTSVLDINLDTETILTGDIGGVVAAGTVARLVAPARLIANLHVRGTLRNDPHGVVDANGFDIHTHDGGVVDLQGIEKTAWVRWGDTPVGWQVGDRLAVAPTKQTFNASGVMTGVFTATEVTWTGSWATMTGPANSPNVLLTDGRTALPEVINLSQTFTIENADRIMLHESTVPNVHTFKWIRVLNAGKSEADAGELGHYPIHFHMLGDTCRGSVIEGVVVEGGKHHAFVPHASHGITFKGCVAYNTTEEAYWWDPDADGEVVNSSHDIAYLDCLAVRVLPKVGSSHHRLDAFHLGQGNNNRCIGCVAVGVLGGSTSAGFHWPEGQGAVWEFDNNVAHNNKTSGIFVWQNSDLPHVITDFTAYRIGKVGVNHGAYRNSYRYTGISLTETGDDAFMVHALPRIGIPLTFEDIATDNGLLIRIHNVANMTNPVIYRRAMFTDVKVQETPDGKQVPGWHRFEDCGLVPADFDLTLIHPDSLIQIVESDVVVHTWDGAWS